MISSKYKLSTVNRALLTILFLIICSSLSIFYSINGVVDAFSFWHMAFVQKFLLSAHFPLEDIIYSPKYVPGFISTLMLLLKVTAIPTKQFHFLPILGLLLPISYFALCKKFSNSRVSVFIIVLLMLSIPTPTEFFTVWPHAFGYFLFLSFIHIFLRNFNNKTPEAVLIIIIIFLSVHFYSYTTEMWILSFFTFFIFISLFFFFISKNKLIKKNLMFSLLVAFFVIFFGFNKIFYESYLPTGKFISTIFESSELFFYNYGNFFSFTESHKYVYRTEPNLFLSLSGLLYLSSMALIVLFSSLQYLHTLIKSGKFRDDIGQAKSDAYFKYALIVTGVCDILIYAARGVITLRYIYFIFPIVTLISLKELRLKEGFKTCILFFLLFLVISHTILSWSSNSFTSDPTQYKDLEISANWFMENSIQKKALTDLLTGNKYLLESVSINQEFDKVYINLDHYDMIVNPQDYEDNELNIYAPYLIINKNLKKVLSDKWGNYESFSYHLKEINENQNLNKIYNDDIIFIFSTEK